MIKRNGRYLTDEELYPEQFMELPEEAEATARRRRAVKLEDIELDEWERSTGKARERGKSPELGKSGARGSELRELLGATAPKWSREAAKGSESTKDAVNPRSFSKKSRESNESDVEVCDSFEELKSRSSRETAKAYAMKVVAAGAVTERKLSEKLKARGYETEEIEEALEYVKSFGYVNDARLAQEMVEKLAARCWGRFKICYYLKGKGIDEETVESLDFSEIDFPFYCARLMKRYPSEKREAMLRAVKNAGYTMADMRAARELMENDD